MRGVQEAARCDPAAGLLWGRAGQGRAALRDAARGRGCPEVRRPRTALAPCLVVCII